MNEAVGASFADSDVVIMAAAVADFRPPDVSGEKLRRGTGGDELQLKLESTPDILAGISRRPERPGKILVGFALEPGGQPSESRRKLEEKGLDLLVWNDPTRAGCGFGSDENQVVLLTAGDGAEELPLLSKREIAGALFDRIVKLLPDHSPEGENAKGDPGEGDVRP
jgi:phosphopantothenoylcysteine decarboxylase/phosphopantothenate--cysteine ligase